MLRVEGSFHLVLSFWPFLARTLACLKKVAFERLEPCFRQRVSGRIHPVYSYNKRHTFSPMGPTCIASWRPSLFGKADLESLTSKKQVCWRLFIHHGNVTLGAQDIYICFLVPGERLFMKIWGKEGGQYTMMLTLPVSSSSLLFRIFMHRMKHHKTSDVFITIVMHIKVPIQDNVWGT